MLPDKISIGYELNDTNFVTIAAACTFVLLRVFTKLHITHSPGWDDCEISLSTGTGIQLVNDVESRYCNHSLVHSNWSDGK